MNYLQKKIKQYLDKEGYALTIHTLAQVEEYIDTQNEMEDGLYDVSDWFRDTKQNYPEMLIDVDETLELLTRYLIRQTRDCYDQTGCFPCVEDYKMALAADDCPVKISLELLIRIMIDKIEADI